MMIHIKYQNVQFVWMNLKMTSRFFKYQNANITSILNAVKNGFLVKIKEKKKDVHYVI